MPVGISTKCHFIYTREEFECPQEQNLIPNQGQKDKEQI